MSIDPNFSPHIKINLKCLKDENVRTKTKVLGRNIGENICALLLRNHEFEKIKTDKLRFITIKNKIVQLKIRLYII